jgi:hypothetical protein
MQCDGLAIFINDLVSLDMEAAVDADKCLLAEAGPNKSQTGKTGQNNS